MKKLESNRLNMAVVMTAIAVAAAGLLGWVNSFTQEPIAQKSSQADFDAIRSVIIGDRDIEFTVAPAQERNGFVFHKVTGADGRTLGTAVKSTDPNGFGGDLTIMVGFDTEGEILGYKVLDHSETPGLGAQADEWFRQPEKTGSVSGSKLSELIFGAPSKAGSHNIIGMNPADDVMTVSSDGGQVDAITASTITSKAFLRAVNAAFKELFGYTAADAVSGASY
ncbi:MAG: RnfABCDGE type electron transport complex subunit G [Bacteroidaceae bacterium]|nr:RnfABCDGE type electron transport complex subunit G [Bacteroidaceae bacterium]